MYYTSTFQEYDELLSKNIVFIHLFDAAANNTVLECIIRNTPIIVNRIEAVVEYLGEDYPLYFNELSEVPDLLNKVEQAHIYLKNMDKTSISMDYFCTRLLGSINYSFNGISLDLLPKYLIKQEILPEPEPEPQPEPEIVNKNDCLIEPNILSNISNIVNQYKTNFIEQMKINFQNNFNFQVDPKLNFIVNKYNINFIEQMEFKMKNEMILPHLQNLEFKLLKQMIDNKIIDCFIFYNELDLLIYRLNILNNVVDYFVLVESKYTFMGNQKELYYQNNKHLFKDFQHKIIHIVLNNIPYEFPDTNKNQQWINEIYQRNCIKHGISKLKLNLHDLIIIADVDEIPDPNTLIELKNKPVTINGLEMDFYYYNLNSKIASTWNKCKILSYSKYKEYDNCEEIRMSNNIIIKKGGWHLSYFGDSKFISNKITNFSHQEFNNETYNNIDLIENNINTFTDVFGRPGEKIQQIFTQDNCYLPPEYQTYFPLNKTMEKSVNFIINNDCNHDTINVQGCGASEVLFYNTAFSLSKIFKVNVYNHNGSCLIDNVSYKDYNSFNTQGQVTIVQRHFDVLINLHKQFNNTYYLWSHDYLDNGFSHLRGEYSREYINEYFKNNGISIIAVSQFHKQHLETILPGVNVIVIYNALFERVFPKIERNCTENDYVIFGSNWYKGLDHVLNVMRELNKTESVNLLLLKPSYCEMERDFSNYPFVKVIGTVKNKTEYCKLIANSICVLTTSYPETFGCIFAESLHLGTPVVADQSVSAGFHEFIENEYKVDFKNVFQVIEKIKFIKNNNPVVKLGNQFYENEIINEWKKIIS
jgi:beta-1,4-mannosyl-glycoprotein beta-1,4-N-acetylglucosaminyltransferase